MPDVKSVADPRPMLRHFADHDRRGAVWCAGLCALTVRHRMLPRARSALRLALLWAICTPVSKRRLQLASRIAKDDGATGVATYANYYAARSAAFAACASYSGEAGCHAVGAANNAANAFASSTDARHRHLAHLGQLVESQVAELAHPGASPLGEWLLERVKGGREGTLGESLAWARQHRLRWWVPAERFAAERRVYPGPFMGAS